MQRWNLLTKRLPHQRICRFSIVQATEWFTIGIDDDHFGRKGAGAVLLLQIDGFKDALHKALIGSGKARIQKIISRLAEIEFCAITKRQPDSQVIKAIHK